MAAWSRSGDWCAIGFRGPAKMCYALLPPAKTCEVLRFERSACSQIGETAMLSWKPKSSFSGYRLTFQAYSFRISHIIEQCVALSGRLRFRVILRCPHSAYFETTQFSRHARAYGGSPAWPRDFRKLLCVVGLVISLCVFFLGRTKHPHHARAWRSCSAWPQNREVATSAGELKCNTSGDRLDFQYNAAWHHFAQYRATPNSIAQRLR